MRHYDRQTVNQLVKTIGSFVPVKAFPGKYPVHLLLCLWIVHIDEDTGRRDDRVRYFYNGKWNYSALRKLVTLAQKEQVKLADSPGFFVDTQVIEYCQNVVLYQGNLTQGVYGYWHGWMFLNSPARKGHSRTPAAYYLTEYVPVSVRGSVMMVPKNWLRDNKKSTLQAGLKARYYWERG